MYPTVQPYNKHGQDVPYGQTPIPDYSQGPPLYHHGPPPANATPQPSIATVVTYPQTNVIVVPQPSYNDYLGCSIANMIFCCLPIGIAALIFSCKTRDSMSRGDMTSAASDSRTAFTLNMVALGLGLTINIAWIAYLIYVSTTYASTVYTYYG